MRRRDYRRFIKDLRDRCDANSIDVIEVPQRGKGSHRGLIFVDRKSVQKATIVIAGGKDISPGVQRGVLKYLANLAARIALAGTVRRILVGLFKE